MTTLRRLAAERASHKAAAELCEAKAADALERGNREAWEHFAHEADQCWRMNSYVVGEIDRLTEGQT